MAEPIINPWDKVWNPIRVCDGKIDLVESRLMQPLKWRKPAKIFVNSASDLFHESIPDAIIDRIFAVMALAPQHVFQLLSKRSVRMRTYYDGNPLPRIAALLYDAMYDERTDHTIKRAIRDRFSRADMENCEATRPGSEAGRGILHRREGQPMPTRKSGIYDLPGISTDHNNDQRHEDGDWRASSRLDEQQRGNPGRPDDKSQERHQRRQSPKELGTGNDVGTAAPCDRSFERQSQSADRKQESKDTDHGDRRFTDAADARQWSDGERHRGTLQNGIQGRLEDLHQKDLASHLIWPLPNVWLGTTAENQEAADARIPDLLATPAAIRWVSIEPMLGQIDLNAIDVGAWLHALKQSTPHPYDPIMKWPLLKPFEHMESGYSAPGLDWIVTGSESGPNARPCNLAWVRSLKDQCVASGVPFFWKQHIENKKKITLPEMDGRQWAEFPL